MLNLNFPFYYYCFRVNFGLFCFFFNIFELEFWLYRRGLECESKFCDLNADSQIEVELFFLLNRLSPTKTQLYLFWNIQFS